MTIRLFYLVLAGFFICQSATADLFLIQSSDGPASADPAEMKMVLEKGILPLFAELSALQARKKLVTGGLPAGSRTLYMVVEADSHDEVDRMLRGLPGWGLFAWTVTPLQSFRAREAIEKDNLKALKSGG